jgi:hypothetical protein
LSRLKTASVTIFSIVVTLVAVVVGGAFWSIISDSVRSAPSAKTMSASELVSATPTGLSPSDPSVSAFGMFSDTTSVKRDEYTKAITGKLVQWTLPLYDASTSGEDLVIQTSAGSGKVVAVCRVKDASKEDIDKAGRLSRGDDVTCKGIIAGPGIMGSINIDPALIIW